jgi:hypothetical protein
MLPSWHAAGLAAIPHCPVLRPTWAEFADAAAYLQRVSAQYSDQVGCVQIIPPPGFAMSYRYDLEQQLPSTAAGGEQPAQTASAAPPRYLRFDVREQRLFKPLLSQWLEQGKETTAAPAELMNFAEADAQAAEITEQLLRKIADTQASPPSPTLATADASCADPPTSAQPAAPSLLPFVASAGLSLQLLSRPYKPMSLKGLVAEARQLALHWNTREKSLATAQAAARRKEQKQKQKQSTNAASDDAAAAPPSAPDSSAASRASSPSRAATPSSLDAAAGAAVDPRVANEQSYWSFIYTSDRPRTLYATDVEVRQEFRRLRAPVEGRNGTNGHATSNAAGTAKHSTTKQEPPAPIWACQSALMRAIVLEYGFLDANKRAEVEQKQLQQLSSSKAAGTSCCPFCTSASCHLVQSPSAWDLFSLAWLPRGLLRHLDGSAPGVTEPMIYLGIHHSTFAVHNEDHYAYSLSYMHALEGDEGDEPAPANSLSACAPVRPVSCGPPLPRSSQKTWYSVAGRHSALLESAVHEDLLAGLHGWERPLSLLPRKSTVVSPVLLAQRGIPVVKAFHQPNTFILTFPQAYHFGHSESNGYNLTESVNFLLPDWLCGPRADNDNDASIPRPLSSLSPSPQRWSSGCGLKALRTYRSLHRTAVLPHERLVIAMAESALAAAAEAASSNAAATMTDALSEADSVELRRARGRKRTSRTARATPAEVVEASSSPQVATRAELEVDFLQRVSAELHELIEEETTLRATVTQLPNLQLVGMGDDQNASSTARSKARKRSSTQHSTNDETETPANAPSRLLRLTQRTLDSAQRAELSIGMEPARREERQALLASPRPMSPSFEPPSAPLCNVHCAVCQSVCSLSFIDCPCSEFNQRWSVAPSTSPADGPTNNDSASSASVTSPPPAQHVVCLRHTDTICPCGHAVLTLCYSLRELQAMADKLDALMHRRMHEETAAAPSSSAASSATTVRQCAEDEIAAETDPQPNKRAKVDVTAAQTEPSPGPIVVTSARATIKDELPSEFKVESDAIMGATSHIEADTLSPVLEPLSTAVPAACADLLLPNKACTEVDSTGMAVVSDLSAACHPVSLEPDAVPSPASMPVLETASMSVASASMVSPFALGGVGLASVSAAMKDSARALKARANMTHLQQRGQEEAQQQGTRMQQAHSPLQQTTDCSSSGMTPCTPPSLLLPASSAVASPASCASSGVPPSPLSALGPSGVRLPVGVMSVGGSLSVRPASSFVGTALVFDALPPSSRPSPSVRQSQVTGHTALLSHEQIQQQVRQQIQQLQQRQQQQQKRQEQLGQPNNEMQQRAPSSHHPQPPPQPHPQPFFPQQPSSLSHPSQSQFTPVTHPRSSLTPADSAVDSIVLARDGNWMQAALSPTLVPSYATTPQLSSHWPHPSPLLHSQSLTPPSLQPPSLSHSSAPLVLSTDPTGRQRAATAAPSFVQSHDATVTAQAQMQQANPPYLQFVQQPLPPPQTLSHSPSLPHKPPHSSYPLPPQAQVREQQQWQEYYVQQQQLQHQQQLLLQHQRLIASLSSPPLPSSSTVASPAPSARPSVGVAVSEVDQLRAQMRVTDAQLAWQQQEIARARQAAAVEAAARADMETQRDQQLRALRQQIEQLKQHMHSTERGAIGQ